MSEEEYAEKDLVRVQLVLRSKPYTLTGYIHVDKGIRALDMLNSPPQFFPLTEVEKNMYNVEDTIVQKMDVSTISEID